MGGCNRTGARCWYLTSYLGAEEKKTKRFSFPIEQLHDGPHCLIGKGPWLVFMVKHKNGAVDGTLLFQGHSARLETLVEVSLKAKSIKSG
jgi:hypothetical protein